MPRLVRRRPLMERLKTMLNPMDFLLWLSEEIETREWNSKVVGTQMGLAMNFAFLIARANSGRKAVADDVFGDDNAGSGWLTFFVGILVWSLMGLSVANAIYTVNRTRKYRLFEADVEKEYDTPSAQRVRVQSSPVSSSPLRFLTDMITTESADSRAHPDRTRDVWELSVWDPLPISLQIFCLFSPGHMLVYMMFLPLAPLDARPSVTVLNCLVLQVILSTQLLLLQSRFSQQNKDTSIIQREVLHEYDTKFVHPRLYPVVRDAATQLSQDDDGNPEEFVQVGTPTTVLRRGFKTNPNPNYTKHFDPDGTPPLRAGSTNVTNPGLFTPPVARQSDAFASSIRPRPAAFRRSTPGLPAPMRRSSAQSVATSTSTTQTQAHPHQPQFPSQGQGNGSYLGVYSHPSSPLKKAPSLGELQFRSPRNNSEMAQLEQYQAYKDRERSSSPVKSTRKSTGGINQSWGGQARSQYERYPSRW